ncbi:MAG: hypothetical protein ABSH41_15920 [Syntrophobacteraceae bacterium]
MKAKVYFGMNILLSIMLGYGVIYVSLYLSLKLQKRLLIPIVLSIVHKSGMVRTSVLEYSSRFLIGFIIGVMHGILIKIGLNIYGVMTMYCIYLVSPIQLHWGKIYGAALNERDSYKIMSIRFTLKVINLLGYTIPVYYIYHLSNH